LESSCGISSQTNKREKQKIEKGWDRFFRGLVVRRSFSFLFGKKRTKKKKKEEEQQASWRAAVLYRKGRAGRTFLKQGKAIAIFNFYISKYTACGEYIYCDYSLVSCKLSGRKERLKRENRKQYLIKAVQMVQGRESKSVSWVFS
jgi:hypothetical protein